MTSRSGCKTGFKGTDNEPVDLTFSDSDSDSDDEVEFLKVIKPCKARGTTPIVCQQSIGKVSEEDTFSESSKSSCEIVIVTAASAVTSVTAKSQRINNKSPVQSSVKRKRALPRKAVVNCAVASLVGSYENPICRTLPISATSVSQAQSGNLKDEAPEVKRARQVEDPHQARKINKQIPRRNGQDRKHASETSTTPECETHARAMTIAAQKCAQEDYIDLVCSSPSTVGEGQSVELKEDERKPSHKDTKRNLFPSREVTKRDLSPTSLAATNETPASTPIAAHARKPMGKLKSDVQDTKQSPSQKAKGKKRDRKPGKQKNAKCKQLDQMSNGRRIRGSPPKVEVGVRVYCLWPENGVSLRSFSYFATRLSF